MATTQIKPTAPATTGAGTGWPRKQHTAYENRVSSVSTSLSINRPINL